MKINADFFVKKLFLALLFLSGTLLHGASDQNISGFSPPELLQQMGVFFVYSFYTLAIIFYLFKLGGGQFKVVRGGGVLILLSYLILLLFSLAYQEDVVRYLLLVLLPVVIPSTLRSLFGGSDECYMSGIFWGVLVYLGISFFLSFIIVSPSGRISGYLGNPNAFAMSIVICALFSINHKSISNYVKIVLGCCCFYLILLSGSRTSLYIFILLFFLWVYKVVGARLGKLTPLILIPLVLIVVYISSGIFDLNGLGGNFERAFLLKDAVTDSGRDVVWARAIEYIDKNFLIGNGMVAHEELVGSGNLHSSYLRIVFMIGVPGALLFYFFYFAGLFSYIKNANNSIVISYMLSIPIFLIPEDYIVGVGSFFYLVFLLIIGSNTLVYKNDGK